MVFKLHKNILFVILVLDLPSPPRNLYTTSYEFNKFLHWTSANYTGGLPTHYSVHIHCTDMPNCSRELTGVLYVPEVISDCDSVKHVDGKNYNCSLQSANMFFGYRATVFAVNELGNSSASVFFHRPIQIHPDSKYFVSYSHIQIISNTVVFHFVLSSLD